MFFHILLFSSAWILILKGVTFNKALIIEFAAVANIFFHQILIFIM